jgi:hypothetical protein
MDEPIHYIKLHFTDWAYERRHYWTILVYNDNNLKPDRIGVASALHKR